jgi:hypothetical protein
MPTQTGFIVPTPFPDTASPGALPLGADVPAGANLCVALLSGSNDAGVTLNSLASNFTTAGFVLTNHPGFTGYGVQFGVAQVNSSGSGKTLTPVWSTTLGYGPTCTLLFFNVSDPAACIAELSAEGTRLQLDNSSDTTPKVLNVSADSVADLVYAHDCKYTTSSVIPGLDAAYTNVTTQADLRGATTRTSRKTAVTVGTNSGTTTDTDYSALAVFVIRDIGGGGGDTTDPTLTGSITEVSKTSASISISWPAGADNVGVTSYEVSRDAGSSWTDVGNVLSHTFSGLSASTAYAIRVRAKDAAGLTSTPPLATSITTSAAGDVTLPTMNGAITVGQKTSGSISISYPAASDNVGVTGYEVSSNGGSSWLDNGLVLSYTFLGLAAVTSYNLRVRAYDGAGNRAATPLAATSSTYGNGATGQYILDHPESFMAQCVEAGDEAAWFEWELITGPATGTWVEGPYADGTGVFEGPDATSMVIRLRKNGVVVGDFTVYLYDPGHYATPANSVSGATSTASNGVQTYRATPAGARAGATVSSTTAVQVQLATPADAVGGATVAPSNAVQTYRATPANCMAGATATATSAGGSGEHQATPANSVSGATVSSSNAVQTHLATSADSVSGATSSSSQALQTFQATPADCGAGATVQATRAFVLSRAPSSDRAYYPVSRNRAYFPSR